MSAETIPQTIEAWVRALQAAGCSPNTIRQRREFVQRRLSERFRDPRTWTRDDVERFLSSNPGWSPNTRLTYFRNAKAWFSWLDESDRITASPMRRMKPPRRPRGVPHPVDTDLLQRAIESAAGELRAILILAAYQGLRVSEVAAFRGEQIRGQELRVTGKGGVTASLPLHPLVAELARTYPARGWWFPARAVRFVAPTQYPHRHPNGVTEVVREHLKGLGGTGTPHSLRHWFGTEVLEASGGNLRTAQQLLRHASVATTEIYTQVRDANRTAAVLALPGLRAAGGAR